jgi:hypothetical protein
LRTNADLNPLEAMLCYKRLGTVEQTVRTAKHLFSTRPIFHKLDETIRGHVFCSFLALAKTELEERIAAHGRVGSKPQIIADLDSLTETEIEYAGKRFIVRSAPRPAASLASRRRTTADRPRGRGVLKPAPSKMLTFRRKIAAGGADGGVAAFEENCKVGRI